MKFRIVIILTAFFGHAAGKSQKPNIILIYADDLGYGDISCNGATRVQTPHTDQLAKEGLKFTSAYSSSSTCTPSRYSILTGEYAFRQTGTGILPGDANLIIAPGRATLPSVLKTAGYQTAVVGKWHLGLGDGEINWNGEIKPSPNDIGFDSSFIMAATGDRVPCVYVRNHHVENLDPNDPLQVSYKHPFPGELDGGRDRANLKLDWSKGHNQAVINGVGRIGYMTGGKAAIWDDHMMCDVFSKEAISFIERSKDGPFFLYYATQDIHVPRLPNARFVGKSQMGPRGDAIVEFDWQVGQVVAALDRLDLTDNTLIILTSDNGPVIDDGYKDQAEEKLGDHKAAGPYRDGKYHIYEGGLRMPMIVRWPGHVKPGTTSDALISQVDFPARLAALAGVPFPKERAQDSQNMLPALLGESKTGRDSLLEYAKIVAVRAGDWKLIPRYGKEIPKSGHLGFRLYHLSKDIGEKTDVASKYPEKVEQLRKLLPVR